MYVQGNLVETLHLIPWFVDLSEQQLERIASIAHIDQILPGDCLFREGDRTEALFVLLDGQIELEMFVPGWRSACIFTAEPLDIIGWSTLTPVVRQRTATARALLPCRVLVLEGKSLQELCDEDPIIGYTVYKRLSNIVASRLLTTRLTLSSIVQDKFQV